MAAGQGHLGTVVDTGAAGQREQQRQLLEKGILTARAGEQPVGQ